MIKNRVFYILLLLGSAFFYFYTFNRITLMGFLIAAAMPPLSYLLGAYAMKRLEVSQRIEERLITKGETTRHLIEVKNKSILPASGVGFLLESNESLIIDAAVASGIDIGPKGARTVAVKLFGRYRGFCGVGAYAVEAYDLLRLFKVKKKLRGRMHIAIYPRIIETDELSLTRSLINREQARYDFSMEDYEETSDVRQYRDSDPIKKIHWKLSAKFQDWIVKNYQTNAWDAITVVPDRSGAGAEVEDRVLEIAVSIGYGILKRRKSVSLVYGGGRLDARYMEDFEGYYYLLARTEFGGSGDEAFPAGFIEDHLQGVNINVVIITSKPVAVSGAVMKARDLGHSVTVAYVRPRDETRESRGVVEALEKKGVPFVYFELERSAA